MKFAWSYSKLKNNDTCPKRHYEIDIAKNYSDTGGAALLWGNKVHDAFHKTLRDGTPLPPEMADYQKWIDMVLAGTGELLVEQKFALTKDLQPTEYFSPRVWYRGICDALRVDGPVAVAVDWKTGQIKVDSTQLMLMAACIFAYHPEVQKILTRFVWLQEDCATDELYTRQSVANDWAGILPRVQAYEEQVRSGSFPPKPGGLCVRHCIVSSCQFHGKGNR